MILGDVEVRKALQRGLLGINPFRESNLKGASYDFHLSPHFRVFNANTETVIDPLVDQQDLWLPHTAEEFFILRSGEFALGSSIERFTYSDNFVGRLEGKSSVARFGLIIHAAGFFDPAFRGYATLELFNPTSLPIKLYPGMFIGQMSFMRVDGKVTKPYGGKTSKYQDQGPMPTASRYHENYTQGYTPADDLEEMTLLKHEGEAPIKVPDSPVASTDMDAEFVDVRRQVEHDLNEALHPKVPPHIGAFRSSYPEEPGDDR